MIGEREWSELGLKTLIVEVDFFSKILVSRESGVPELVPIHADVQAVHRHFHLLTLQCTIHL